MLRSYQTVEFDLQHLAREAEASGKIALHLKGKLYELELIPHDLRADDYRAIAMTDQGEIDITESKINTYRGFVTGDVGSEVRLFIAEGLIMGHIRTAEDTLFIEPMANLVPGTKPTRSLVYRDSDVRPAARGNCGTGRLKQEARRLIDKRQSPDYERLVAGSPGVLRQVEVATDADFEAFQRFGSDTNGFILGVLNQVDAIFRQELNLMIKVTFQIVRSSSNDPYTSTNGSGLLDELQDHWIDNWGFVNRDITHLFTGKGLNNVDGIARGIGQTCADPDDSYCISEVISSTSTIVVIAAHEMGHLLGAIHDDPAICGTNTPPIMCPGTQHLGSKIFSPASRQDIADYVASEGSCLSAVNAELFGGGVLRKQYTGWNQNWDIIVGGNFGGTSWGALLFYDQQTGIGEFYTSDGAGNLSLLRRHTWNQGWDVIIPGNFSGDSRSDLFFYDRERGLGAFFSTDGLGNINLLQLYYGFRTTWSIIVPGQFGGDQWTDLLFYEGSTGLTQIFTTNGSGGIGFLKEVGLTTNLTSITPGNFGGNGFTDLLLYNRSTRLATLCTTDGAGNIGLLRHYTDFPYTAPPVDFIVPGEFTGAAIWTDLYFIDAAGKASLYTTDGTGGLIFDWNGGISRTLFGWTHVVWGDFAPSTGVTDLIFYRRSAN